MTWSRAPALAWTLGGIVAALASARLAIAVAAPEPTVAVRDPRGFGAGPAVAAFEALLLAALGVVGAIVAARRPRNPVGWIFCVLPVSLGTVIVADRAWWVLASTGRAEQAELAAWVASWAWVPGVIPALTLFPLLFPSGRPPTPRWRPVAWAGIAACPCAFLDDAFRPGPLEAYPTVSNPVAAHGVLATGLEVVAILGLALMAAAAVGATAAIIVRFRRSRGVERQQLKWVTAATALLLALFVGPVDDLAGEEAGFLAILTGLLAVAAAVATSILRHRLYDVDLVIRRTLVYGALTATLAAGYLGGVLLAQLVTGADSDLAIAASTLAMAALFRPLRSRIQEGVDRRFYRGRYDAAQTVEAFASRLRQKLDLDEVADDLRSVAHRTVRPAHVSLWLRGRS